MIGVTIKDGATPTIAKIVEGMDAAMRRGTFRAAQMAAGEIRREVLSTFEGTSGGLARSFKAKWISQAPLHVSAAALSDAVQARILNDGGPITPKRRKSLAVPIGAGKRRRGMKGPREFPEKGPRALHFIKRGFGRPPLLATVTRNRVTPMFVLLKVVNIRGRHYIDKAKTAAQPEINKILGREVETTIVRAVK